MKFRRSKSEESEPLFHRDPNHSSFLPEATAVTSFLCILAERFIAFLNIYPLKSNE